MNVSNNLEENIKMLKETFKQDQSLILREFSIGGVKNVECLAVFIDGMVDLARIDSEIISPLLKMKNTESDTDIYLPSVLKNSITSAQVETTSSYDNLFNYLVNGYTVVFIDGYDIAIAMNTLSINRRKIGEPETEKVVRGPREGFNESLLTNI
ncbi:MAG TPA: spore germination protein, partial [Patescibacteria group bacterium]|nr:spore germination protein [Patescibacteria group bacterium]